MGKRFTAGEVADIAVCVEKNGERFFSACAARSLDPGVSKTFELLAESEREHAAVFQEMGEKFAESQPKEYAGEESLYFQAMADEAVLTCNLVDEQLACPEMSTKEAVELSLKIVNDAIQFYEGLLGYVSWRDSRVVKRMVREEKEHLDELQSLGAGVEA